VKTLLIDAATTTLFVGAFDDGGGTNGPAWLKLLKKQEGALEGLFDLAKALFETHPLESFERIALCEGPGRLMSLRIAAVAGNQWAGDRPTSFPLPLGEGITSGVLSLHPLKNFDEGKAAGSQGAAPQSSPPCGRGQGVGENRQRATYNSLRLSQELSPSPVAFELRAGAFAIWKNNKVEVVGALPIAHPQPAVLIGSSVSPDRENPALYAQAIEKLPGLAEKILKPVEFFDPPLWAPIDYVKAGNKAVSKER
jgi:hypothetical protein